MLLLIAATFFLVPTTNSAEERPQGHRRENRELVAEHAVEIRSVRPNALLPKRLGPSRVWAIGH